LSKERATFATAAVLTVTVISFDVAVANATVAASMILNFAVPEVVPVTSQSCLWKVAFQVHADGVTEPATNASAADEA